MNDYDDKAYYDLDDVVINTDAEGNEYIRKNGAKVYL